MPASRMSLDHNIKRIKSLRGANLSAHIKALQLKYSWSLCPSNDSHGCTSKTPPSNVDNSNRSIIHETAPNTVTIRKPSRRRNHHTKEFTGSSSINANSLQTKALFCDDNFDFSSMFLESISIPSYSSTAQINDHDDGSMANEYSSTAAVPEFQFDIRSSPVLSSQALANDRSLSQLVDDGKEEFVDTYRSDVMPSSSAHVRKPSLDSLLNSMNEIRVSEDEEDTEYDGVGEGDASEGFD